MFCSNCGKEIDDNAIICIHCGVSTKVNQRVARIEEDGELGGLLTVVCFLAPIAGLILYLVWKDSMPYKSKQAGKWALIGVGANVAFTLLYVIFLLGVSPSYY